MLTPVDELDWMVIDLQRPLSRAETAALPTDAWGATVSAESVLRFMFRQIITTQTSSIHHDPQHLEETTWNV